MSRILSSMLAFAAMTTAVAPAAAQDAATTPVAASTAVTPKVGQVLRDANGRRLAAIESIQAGSVQVILDMRMYRIPTSTLSVTEKGLQTSLTRSELH